MFGSMAISWSGLLPRVVLALLGGAALWVTPCSSQEPFRTTDYVFIRYSSSGNIGYRFAISHDAYARLPSWTPEAGSHPPVTPKAAIDLAQSFVDTLPTDPDRHWSLLRLGLWAIAPDNDDTKWMYMVLFENKPNNLEPTIGNSGQFSCFVTLDGKLLEPVLIDRYSLEYGRDKPQPGLIRAH